MSVVSRKLLSASVFVLVAAGASVASAAQVDCTRPAGKAETRACAAAVNGVAALRQFIQRTRGIYILFMPDFERAVPASAAAESPPKAA